MGRGDPLTGARAGGGPDRSLATGLAAALDRSPLSWSVVVQPVTGAAPLLSHGAGSVLPTASMGKLLVLIEVADGIVTGRLDPARLLRRDLVDPVGDSGLWQHLAAPELSVADLAVLVGATSDNLAANVLLDLVGVDQVQAHRTAWGLEAVSLHDRIRDERGPDHPSAPSTASAAGLVELCTRIHADDVATTGVGPLVRGWLSLGTDLSMVAGALGLDPLAHGGADRGVTLWHKTGTDAGVRADAGVVTGPHGDVAYAAVAGWAPTRRDVERDLALRTMDRIGALVREAATGSLT